MSEQSADRVENTSSINDLRSSAFYPKRTARVSSPKLPTKQGLVLETSMIASSFSSSSPSISTTSPISALPNIALKASNVTGLDETKRETPLRELSAKNDISGISEKTSQESNESHAFSPVIKVVDQIKSKEYEENSNATINREEVDNNKGNSDQYNAVAPITNSMKTDNENSSQPKENDVRNESEVNANSSIPSRSPYSLFNDSDVNSKLQQSIDDNSIDLEKDTYVTFSGNWISSASRVRSGEKPTRQVHIGRRMTSYIPSNPDASSITIPKKSKSDDLPLKKSQPRHSSFITDNLIEVKVEAFVSGVTGTVSKKFNPNVTIETVIQTFLKRFPLVDDTFGIIISPSIIHVISSISTSLLVIPNDSKVLGEKDWAWLDSTKKISDFEPALFKHTLELRSKTIPIERLIVEKEDSKAKPIGNTNNANPNNQKEIFLYTCPLPELFLGDPMSILDLEWKSDEEIQLSFQYSRAVRLYEWDHSDKEGELLKQGSIVKTNWNPRWFVLKGKKLFYFKVRPSQSPYVVSVTQTRQPTSNSNTGTIRPGSPIPISQQQPSQQQPSQPLQLSQSSPPSQSSQPCQQSQLQQPLVIDIDRATIEEVFPSGNMSTLRKFTMNSLPESKQKNPLFYFEITENEGKCYFIAAKTRNELEEWIFALRNAAHGPSNAESVVYPVTKIEYITQKVTVTFNAQSGYSGLSNEWKEVLRNYGFTERYFYEHHNEVLHLLRFHSYLQQAENSEDPSIPIVIHPAPKHKHPIDIEEVINKDVSPEYLYEDFELLGSGTFGEVYLATNIRSRQKVAIKKMLLTPKREPLFISEINVQRNTEHPNVVKLFDAYRVENYIWVALEFMENGNLYEIFKEMEASNRTLSEPQIAYVISETLKALSYIHGMHRIHRDIKSDNILLGKNAEIKLADFGYAVQLSDEEEKRNTICGSPYWMAPEIIQGERYAKQVDIWSLGIMLIECCDLQPPYILEPPSKALLLISSNPSPRMRNPDKWSNELNDFLSLCLSKDPQERPQAIELLQHPFLLTICPATEFRDNVIRLGVAGSGSRRKACIIS